MFAFLDSSVQASKRFWLHRAIVSRALPCVLAVALAGCASESSVQQHGVPLVGRFDGASARPATDLSRWWVQFGSQLLNALIEQGEQGNFDLAAAITRIEQADAQARVSGAALLPTLTGSSNESRSQSSGTTSRVGVFNPTQRNSFSGGLSASFEIDIWGRNRDLLRAANSQSDAAHYAYEVVRLTMQAGTVNAWLQYAAARDRLAIASENLRNAERVSRVIAERLAAGTASALDRAQQESLVASQRAALPPLRQSAEFARTSLALLTGRVPEGFKVSAVTLSQVRVPPVRPGLPSSLLVRRPDIRNAEVSLAAADANVDAARKAMLPSLQLTGQGGVQSAALNTLLRPESVIWSLASGLTQSIFDGGQLKAQSDLAVANQQELLENYRKAIVSALVDVENALVALREGAARETAQTSVVSKAREAFGFAEQRFREGTVDLQTLLNTQSTLFQAQDTLVQVRLSRLQASVSLFQALGGDFVSQHANRGASSRLAPTSLVVESIEGAQP